MKQLNAINKNFIGGPDAHWFFVSQYEVNYKKILVAIIATYIFSAVFDQL